MPHVNVVINGRTYRMACDAGQEEHLVALGARLDAQVADLRGAFGDAGDQRLIVMGAILTTDRLVDAERRIADLGAEIARLAATQAELRDRFEASEAALAKAVETAARRIEALADRAAASAGLPAE